MEVCLVNAHYIERLAIDTDRQDKKVVNLSGGKERDTLFITASKGLYGLRMKVKGVGSQ